MPRRGALLASGPGPGERWASRIIKTFFVVPLFMATVGFLVLRAFGVAISP